MPKRTASEATKFATFVACCSAILLPRLFRVDLPGSTRWILTPSKILHATKLVGYHKLSKSELDISQAAWKELKMTFLSKTCVVVYSLTVSVGRVEEHTRQFIACQFLFLS